MDLSIGARPPKAAGKPIRKQTTQFPVLAFTLESFDRLLAKRNTQVSFLFVCVRDEILEPSTAGIWLE